MLRLVVAGIVWLPMVALAEHPRVEAARRAYEELRFEDVLVTVATARREGSLSRADEVELTRLEAYTFAVFDDEAHAVEAFQRLLALEPSFVPEGVSPKIRSYFEKARRTPPPPRPNLVPQGPPAAPPRPRPAPERPRAWYRSPWLWSAVGVAAVLGATGAFVLYDRQGPSSASGNLGALDLQ